MGTFTWPLRISSMDGQHSLDVEATVDTGAFYTTLPARLLRELGIEPMGTPQVPGSRWSAGGDGVRAGVGHDRPTRVWSLLSSLEKDGAPPLIGSLHPGGAGPGGGPHLTATGPNASLIMY